MKLTKYMLVVLGLGLAINATAGIREKKHIVNGCRIVVIKTGGIIVPGTTSVLYYPTNQPGVLMGVTSASNPGVLGMTAGAAGQATSGGLIRPAKVEVHQGASAETFSQGGEAIVTGGAGGNGGSGGNGGNGHNGNNGNGGNPHFN